MSEHTKPSKQATGRIAVIIEGGLVQDVITDDPSLLGIDVLVIDYDGATDPADQLKIPQSDGSESSAWCYWQNTTKARIDLEEVVQRKKSTCQRR